MELLRMMWKNISSVIFFFSICLSNLAQDSTDYSFANWLYAKKQYKLACIESERLFAQTQQPEFQYIANKCHFKLGNYDQIRSVNLLSDSIATIKSRLLYLGSCLLFKTLPKDSIENSSIIKNDYYLLYQSVYYLQKKDFSDYSSFTKNNPITHVNLNKHATNLENIHSEYKKYNNKKPILASGLSFVLPGLGKIYAGRPNEFIGPLIKSIFYGLIAYEGYRKNEFNSVQFYAFSSLFLFNYTSTIYGSYKAVQINKADYEKKYYEKLVNSYQNITNDLIDQ